MSDKIEYDDLVGDAPFEKIIEKAEQIIAVFGKVERTVVKSMSSIKSGLDGGTPKTLGDAEEISKLIKKVDELEKALNKTKQAKGALTVETAKAKLELAAYNKEVTATAKESLGMVSEYQRQSAALNDLRNQYKDLVLAQKQNTDEGRSLLKSVTDLDTKLKAVDATVGQHQRNVGNYTGSLQKLGKGFGGLTGLVASFGAALGFDAEALERFHETSKELIHTTRELHHALELNEVAEESHTAAVEGNTVATEEAAVAQTELAVATEESNLAFLATPVGIFASIAVGVAAIAAVIYEFTKAEEDSAEAIKIFTEALTNEQLEINKLKASILETSIANDVFTGKLTETQGEHLKVNIDGFKKTFEATEEHNKAVKELNDEYGQKEAESLKKQVEARQMGVIFAGNSIEMYEEERHKKLGVLENKFQEHLSNIKIDADQKNTVISNNASDKEKNAISKGNDEKLKLEEDYWKKLRDLRTGNIDNDYVREKQVIIDQYNDEATKYAGQTAILKELKIKRLRDLSAVDDRYFPKTNADTAAPDQMAMRTDKPEDHFMENEQKRLDKEKAIHDAEVQEAQQMREKLLSIYEDYYQKIEEVQQKQYDISIARNQSNIEIQTALAARGVDNTLGYEMEKRDMLEKQRAEDLEKEKKHAKQMEAVQLSLAFIKAYEDYIGKGQTSVQALSHASTDVLAAKLLSSAIAGSFAEGIEDFHGRGTGISDSNLIRFSHGESVVTARGTDETPGLVTAINDAGFAGAADWAMKNIYMPQYNSSMGLADVSMRSQVEAAQTSVLVNEIRDLKKTIRDKPETQYAFDEQGNVIKSTVEAGIRKMTTKQTHLS